MSGRPWFGRRHREWHELMEDSRTPFMVGRLIGANEMAIALLSRETNETAVHVAEVLNGVLGFFMEDGAKQLPKPPIESLDPQAQR